MKKQDRVDVCLIFILLACIYGVTYSGTYIADDEHILSSRALSVAFDGQVNDLRVFGNEKVDTFLATTEPYASFGLNIEPLFAYVTAPFFRFAEMLGIGKIQTAFLLNIFVTALTAVSVYCTVRKLGHSRFAGLFAAMGYGLATLAWPYSKTSLRDPLAALLLAISWGSVLTLNSVKGSGKTAHFAFMYRVFIATTAFVLGVLTKNTIFVALPLLIWLFVSRARESGPVNQLRISLGAQKANGNFVGLALILGVLLVGLWLTNRPAELARSSPEYYAFVLKRIATDDHSNFLQAVAGPFISPGKSIFLYSPILILAAVGLWRERTIALPAWGYVVLLVIAQALFYGDLWWGGVNWGLRFVLPAIPLLMIVIGSQVDFLEKIGFRSLLIACGLLSLFPQIVGVSTSQFQFFTHLFSEGTSGQIQQMLWGLGDSPIVVQSKFLLEGKIASFPASRIDEGMPLALAAVLVITLWALMQLRRPKLSAPIALFVVATPLLLFGLVLGYAKDPYYYANRRNFADANQLISSLAEEEDFVFIQSYASPLWYYWMNWGYAGTQWGTLPAHQAYLEGGATADELLTVELIDDIAASHDVVWLVFSEEQTAGDRGGAYLSFLEHSLSVQTWALTDEGASVYVAQFQMADQ